jgi:DNA-binding NarL/FixJ family response regulator
VGAFPVTRVVLLAHSRLYVEALQRCLSTCSNIAVVSASRDARDLDPLIRRCKPHVALVDFTLPGALEQVDALPSTAASPRVVVISTPDDRQSVLACARAGAISIVSKNASFADLATMIDSAKRGEFAASPTVCAWLMAELRSLGQRVPTGACPEVLTTRETETLELMTRGLSNREIATQLGIEICTVKNHVHQVLKKLNVRRRGEAVAFFLGDPRRRLSTTRP